MYEKLVFALNDQHFHSLSQCEQLALCIVYFYLVSNKNCLIWLYNEVKKILEAVGMCMLAKFSQLLGDVSKEFGCEAVLAEGELLFTNFPL